MKQRDYKLDIIRVLACLLVVLMHSPSPDGGQNGLETNGISMFTEPCIGLFFMVSGALLLPVKLSCKDFLKKRFSKVLWPTLIFTFFYLLVSFCYGEISLQKMGRKILSIPFACEGHGILWFMYALSGMYLVAPIISPFLEKATKREVQFVLLLWFVTMCWQIFALWLDVSTDTKSMLYTFSGYGGYFLLGYYLRKYPISLKWFMFPVLFVIPFVSVLASKLMNWNLGLETFFWYLSIFCVMLCLAWWQFVMQYVNTDKIGQRAKSVLVDFSNCSFGIYLIHIFIMRRWVWKLEILHTTPPMCAILIIFLLTVLLSWAFANIVSRMPYGNYIIGYKRKLI